MEYVKEVYPDDSYFLNPPKSINSTFELNLAEFPIAMFDKKAENMADLARARIQNFAKLCWHIQTIFNSRGEICTERYDISFCIYSKSGTLSCTRGKNEQKQKKIGAIDNQKRSGSKSTTAGGLVGMGHRAMLVDLDPQANITLYHKIPVKQLKITLSHKATYNKQYKNMHNTDTFARKDVKDIANRESI